MVALSPIERKMSERRGKRLFMAASGWYAYSTYEQSVRPFPLAFDKKYPEPAFAKPHLPRSTYKAAATDDPDLSRAAPRRRRRRRLCDNAGIKSNTTTTTTDQPPIVEHESADLATMTVRGLRGSRSRGTRPSTSIDVQANIIHLNWYDGVKMF
uniref:Uncharacterized protein n=1 Tax=Panagrellus redivivus TaxID=6233 RepID=A0A7E4VNH3_PANRE